jgi:uroporphyrinogen-III synthase
MQNKVNILSTRPVNHQLIEEASSAGINLEVVSFIETEPIRTIEVQQEIEQALLQAATVVFTSGNAVEAVASESEGQHPEWEIFCLGNTTRDLIIKYFGEHGIAGFADNASDLIQN